MKKKIFIAMLIATMSFSIVACGSTTKEDTKATTESTEEVETTETIESSTEAEEEKLTTEESTESTTETDVNASTETSEAENAPAFTYTDKSGTLYVTQTVNVRDLPDTSGNKLTTIKAGTELILLGQCNETGWYKVEYANDKVGYVSNAYASTDKPAVSQPKNDTAASQQPSGNDGGESTASAPAASGVPEAEIESFCTANGWSLGTVQYVDENTYTYTEAVTGSGHYYGADGFINICVAGAGRNWRQAERVTLYENRNCADNELYFVDIVYVRAN